MPAASDPPPASRPAAGLPARFRPLGTRLAVAAFAVLLVGTMAVIWVSFPDDVRASFTPFQRITVAVMLGGLGAIGYALARSRVDADETGLTVVNGYRRHRLDWAQVVDVTLRPGSPWAVLDLSDGTARGAMGIQSSDGLRARRQARALGALVAAHAAADPEPRRGEGDRGPDRGDRGDDAGEPGPAQG